MFDDTKLPSLQKENDSEILEFENLKEYNIEGEDIPVATEGNNENDDNDSNPSGGDNQTWSTIPGEESFGHAGSSSGGDNEERGSTSNTQHNAEQEDTSRSNLPVRRIWSRDHPFELIIDNLDSGVITWRASQRESLHAAFISELEYKAVDKALEDLDWVIAM